MPISRRVAEDSLQAKGFLLETGRHRKFCLYYQGRKTSVFTITSHGSKHRDITDNILKLMKDELKLDTLQQLRDLLNCPMDYQQYVQFLLSKGIHL